MEPETSSINVDSASKTIILHPGSHSVKFGIASDPWPQFVLNAIAFRTNGFKAPGLKSPNKIITKAKHTTGAFKITIKSAEKPELEKKEEACKLIEENLTETLEQFTAKKRRFNDEVFDEKNSTSTEDEDPYYWTNVSHKPPFVVGEKAIRIPPSEPYELYWPIRYGKINVQNRSIQQVKSALEHIFTYAITEKLNVKLSELKDYQVFLIVGDRIESADVNIFVDVLFRKFQFKALAIHQESVCAAYGVGMATCCVVDIGHMKTSICCVDDGIFLPHTRLFFQYGGYNINRALLYTLQHSKRHYFSYKECDPVNLRDEEGLNLLKESLCNMRRDTLEVENYEFRARTKGQPTKVYKLNVSDALVISPMALFYTGLLEPVDSVRPKNAMIVEDLVDEELKAEIRKVVGDEELYLIPEVSRKVLPVDHAIIESIKSIENLELRQNLISNIVLIGGSARYEGLTTVMEDRVFEQLPEELTAIEKVEVVSNEVSRNVDPRYMSWKGASVCCGFESFSDCWVSKQEWDLFGIRILRERAPFTLL